MSIRENFRTLRLLRVLPWVAMLLLPAAAFGSGHTAAEVLLVYNTRSPVSIAIANDYAAKRGITHILAISCIDSATNTANETIPMSAYTTEIANPVSAYLSSTTGINFIVLTKGVPIRISGAPTGSGNYPSVDSCLASIDYPALSGAVEISIQGSGAAGYGYLNRYWDADAPFSHAVYGGYLVTRLDGYTQSDAMSLVNRALSAEAGLTPYGRILLDQRTPTPSADKTIQPYAITGNVPSEEPYGVWDADMARAGDILESSGLPVDEDWSTNFIGWRSNLLGYYSYGSNDVHFTYAAYESLSFAPGSLGDTAVSTSARTFLPTSGGQSLIADLIAHGLTCAKGDVGEPLLDGISSPTVALSRYLSGYTMAESFYMATRFVGWEDIMIGDPLCCPYPSNSTVQPPIQASNYQDSSNVATETCAEGGLDVVPESNGAYTAYDNINMAGLTTFETRMSCPSGGSTIAIHLDSPAGPLIGACTAPSTGALQTYADCGCALTGATGTHNLYLVYSTGLEMQWVAFQSPSPLLGTLPTPWAAGDIGPVGLPGTQIYSSADDTFTDCGSGAGISGTADAFHYICQPSAGNSAIVARVATEGAANPNSQAGVMIRSGTDPAGPDAAVLVTPGGSVSFQTRTGEAAAATAVSLSGTAPVWVRLIQQNSGASSTFLGFYSPDGLNWSEIGGPVAIPMPAGVLTGLAVASNDNTQVENATLDNVAVSTAVLSGSLANTDIGGGTGGGYYDPGSGIIAGVGSGTMIGGTSDSFHLISQPLAGDSTITALVTESGAGQAGVMMRASMAANDIEASMLLTSGNMLVFQYRIAAGANVISTAIPGAGPVYVRLSMTGAGQTSIAGSYSYDGSHWTTLGTWAPDTMPPTYYAGLAVSGMGTTATFYQSTTTLLPNPWLDADVGPVGVPGSAYDAGGVFDMAGSGAYIGGTSDQFNYAYCPTSGNEVLTAYIASEGDSGLIAKAGIMMRPSPLDPASPEASVLEQPSGLQFEWRSTEGGASASTEIMVWGPVYVRLTRAGNLFTGSYSTDDTHWTTIGSATIAMPAAMDTGLAVSSQSNSVTNPVTFTNVSMLGETPVPGATPPVTTSLQLWLEASAITTANLNPVGGSYYVATWPDESGNGNNATQTKAAYQPLYVSAAANNYPVVKFNGVNNVLNTPLAQISGDKSIFVVMKRIDRVQPSGTEISSTQKGQGMFLGNLNGAESEGRLSIAHDLAVPGLLNNYILKSYIRSGTSGSLMVDGSSTTASVPDVASGNYSISDGYTFPFSGAIAEVLIYNRAVTAAEQQAIENYLSEKYFLWTVQVPVQSGLQLWLTSEAINASSGNQVNNSGGNTYAINWQDQSINGLQATQSHTTWAPIILSNAINGRASLQFNGTDDFMTTTLPQISGDKSIFMVEQRNKPTVGTELASSSTTRGFFLGDDGQGNETKGRILVAHDLLLPGLPKQYFLKTFERAGSLETLTLAGSGASAIVSDTASGDYTLSGGSTSNATFNPFNGDICETLIYNRALSSTEQNLVEDYLQDKWSNTTSNIFSVYPDISVPPMITGSAGPGLRVKETAPTYAGTNVYDALYLPTDWVPGKKYPVIVEYSPNGGYSDAYGDTTTGNVEDDTMGYGITGGAGYIWISMPTVGGTSGPLSNQTQWWGNMASTEDYCLKTVYNVCQNYGGDPSAVILVGGGRGGIACNYIGLFDSNIADVWLAFIPHAGYDGQYTNWPYAGADAASALARLQLLNGRWQHISQESSAASPESYLASTGVSMAPFNFRTLPYVNHTNLWTQYPIQLRRDTRAWLQQVVSQKPGTYSISGNVTSAGVPVQGAAIQSGPTHFTFTDVNGNYVLGGLINSSRVVTATYPGLTFANQEVTVAGDNVQNVDFQTAP